MQTLPWISYVRHLLSNQGKNHSSLMWSLLFIWMLVVLCLSITSLMSLLLHTRFDWPLILYPMLYHKTLQTVLNCFCEGLNTVKEKVVYLLAFLTKRCLLCQFYWWNILFFLIQLFFFFLMYCGFQLPSCLGNNSKLWRDSCVVTSRWPVYGHIKGGVI